MRVVKTGLHQRGKGQLRGRWRETLIEGVYATAGIRTGFCIGFDHVFLLGSAGCNIMQDHPHGLRSPSNQTSIQSHVVECD
jgi:hypothetical protein